MSTVDESAVRGPVHAVVVIPAYNHGPQLLGVLDETARLGLAIVVVNDGSSDGTGAMLAGWARAHADVQLRVETHASNKGKAAALQTGFRAAAKMEATHAATIDADGQLDPGDIPLLLREARQEPRALVLGRRPDSSDGRPERCGVGRRFTSLALLAETGLRMGDTQCGLRVYPLELVVGPRAVRCRAGGYSFEAEVVTRAAWAGFAVREVPVSCRYFPGGGRVSHLRPWRDTLHQAGLHARLMAKALVPWGGTGSRAAYVHEDGKAVVKLPLWRQVIDWFNPWKTWREIREASLGDLELACGLAIGGFIGTLPLYGLHAIIAIYVARRWYQPPSIMIVGTQVSLPPIGVGLAVLSMAVGHLIFHGTLPMQTHVAGHTFIWTAIGAFFKMKPAAMSNWLATKFLHWFVGSLVVGFFVGVAMYFLGLWVGKMAHTKRQVPSPAA